MFFFSEFGKAREMLEEMIQRVGDWEADGEERKRKYTQETSQSRPTASDG